MDGLFANIPGVTVYLDDILITGNDMQSHLEHLETVLERLHSSGLRLKSEKCSFLQPSVVYFGHNIDATGLHTIDDKVKAVMEVPPPTNIHDLQCYLGLINYYRHFLPNWSTILAPLNLLIKTPRRSLFLLVMRHPTG